MYLEIWLNNAPFCYDRALLYDNHGASREVRGIVETSLSGAEVFALYDTNPFHKECLLSWYFKYGILEPRTWDSSIDKIIFHNNSSQEIYIWRYVYLMLNETAAVYHLATQHNTQLGIYRPLGMGRLQLTTNDDNDFRSMLGEHGLILYKRTASSSDTVRIRFIFDRFIREQESDHIAQSMNYGFETSAGELTQAGPRQVLLTTKHSKYYFEIDSQNIF